MIPLVVRPISLLTKVLKMKYDTSISQDNSTSSLKHVFGIKILDKCYWYHPNSIAVLAREIIFWLSMLLFYFGNLGYVIKQIHDGRAFENYSVNLGMLLSATFCFYSIYTIKTNMRSIIVLIQELENNLHFIVKDTPFVKKINWQNRLLTWIYVYICLFVLATFVFVELQNCDIKSHSCGYLMPSYFFIDLINSPYRTLYNMFILFFIIYEGIGTLTVLSLLYTMYTYLEMFVVVLESTLGDVKRTKDWNIRRFKLMIAYKHHIFMLRFWKKVVNLYKWGMLLHIVSSGMEIALILISELIHFEILSICHLSLYLVGTIFVGTLGENLISLGDKIRNSTFYACPWDGDIESVKYLLFMNLNSRKGFNLPAGNYAICSNALALSVYKFAYSVLMLYINSTQDTFLSINK